MYKLKYKGYNESITEISPDGVETLISDDFPSEPEYSPNEKKAIYISPLEWECFGSLYLYDLITGESKILVEPDNEYIPKYAIWLDDENIAVIIGFGSGTVAVGGNVYYYNLNTDTLIQKTEFDNKIQITKLTLVDNKLILDGIEYIDDEVNDFRNYKNELEI